jgi:hypothetical protein
MILVYGWLAPLLLLLVKQYIMAEECDIAELLASWQLGIRKRERGRRRIKVKGIFFKGMSPVTYFLQRSSTS